MKFKWFTKSKCEHTWKELDSWVCRWESGIHISTFGKQAICTICKETRWFDYRYKEGLLLDFKPVIGRSDAKMLRHKK